MFGLFNWNWQYFLYTIHIFIFFVVAVASTRCIWWVSCRILFDRYNGYCLCMAKLSSYREKSIYCTMSGCVRLVPTRSFISRCAPDVRLLRRREFALLCTTSASRNEPETWMNVAAVCLLHSTLNGSLCAHRSSGDCGHFGYNFVEIGCFCRCCDTS